MARRDDRQQRRAERLRLEAEERERERRQRLVRLGSAAVLLAVVVVAVAIALLSSGGDEEGGGQSDAGTQRLIDSLPQSGTTLGKPSAQATIVEFGDLQCPVCKEYSESVVPELISGPVRSGRAKIVFQQLLVIGPDSVKAAKAALAASLQDRYWNFIEAFYANQGEENSGYVTDSFLTSIAKQAKVPDIERWNRDRRSARWNAVLGRMQRNATRFGFNATPSFAVTGPGGKRAVGTPGAAGPIEDALAQIR